MSFFCLILSPEDAFNRTVESITGPISKTISTKGMLALYDALDAAGKKTFEKAYSSAYKAALDICLEVYDEVSSGSEIQSVVRRCARLDEFPMAKIDQTYMWQVLPFFSDFFISFDSQPVTFRT